MSTHYLSLQKIKKCDTYFLYKIIDFFLATLPKSISSLQFQQNITQAINKHNIFTGNKLNKGHHMCSQKNEHHLGTTFSQYCFIISQCCFAALRQFWYSSSFTDGATYKSKQLRISKTFRYDTQYKHRLYISLGDFMLAVLSQKLSTCC